MPSQEGRRSVVLRRLLRWHGRSPERRVSIDRRASIVSVAAAIAMVGAVAVVPAISARTPIADPLALTGRAAFRVDRQPAHAGSLAVVPDDVQLDDRLDLLRSFPETVNEAVLSPVEALGLAIPEDAPGVAAVQSAEAWRAFSAARDAAAAAAEEQVAAEAAHDAAAREAAAREAAVREARAAAARQARVEAAREQARVEAAREAAARETAARARERAREREHERARQERRERRQNPPPPSSGGSGPWNNAPVVTWYGPGFYGNGTACGQRYTREIIGVAHKTLPCGTLVQFRWHGITATAPVIDRGPYAGPEYIFDFSAALACDVFKPAGVKNGCFTRNNVAWRVVGRRR